MFKIALISFFLVSSALIHASAENKTQAEASNSKLAALAQVHKTFLSLAKSKQEKGIGDAPKPFSKADLAGSTVNWDSLGAVAIHPKPATGGAEEVDSIKFAQSGYALSKKDHNPKDPVLVNEKKKYLYGIIVQQKNASHCWVQLENSKVVLISSERIASKK